MAEDLTHDEPQEQSLVRARHDPDARMHRLRFAVAYLALAVVAGAAVGAAILLSDEDRQAAHAAWSTWKPDGNDLERPKAIADYVATQYTHPDGSQLVLVFAGPPTIKTADNEVPIRWVAIRGDEAAGKEDEVVETRESVMYVLCGGGDNCVIDKGEPTAERYRLLRREALELALYSFKYTDATSVITLLPPVQNDSGQQVAPRTLFFQKQDIDSELDRPLQMTLSRPDTPSPAEIDPTESLTIDRLTRPRLFTYEYRQAQEGSAVMLLAPTTLGT